MDFLKRLAIAGATALEFHVMSFWRRYIAAVVIVAAFGIVWHNTLSVPDSFVSGTIVVIPEGATALDAANSLATNHVIRHPGLLRTLLRVSGLGSDVAAGAYRFDASDNLLKVMLRLVTAEYGIEPIRITLIEGMTVQDMAARVAKAFYSLTQSDFIAAGQPYEGYLFPDTYTFTPAATAKTIVDAMRANFVTKLKPYSSAIATSGHTESDVITMASIIEKEANTYADKHMVAGILWNRIRLGMPLQVDAVFGYIYQRQTFSPTYAQLAVDSPYNTYTHKGLPPGPISNPGLDSIDAAIHPTKTAYLYYLTGKDGLMHYATTFAAHQRNETLYLH